MKPQSVDNFILFNIFGRRNKISNLLISVEIRCKGEGCEKMDKVEIQVRAVTKQFCKKGMSQKEIHDNFIKTLGDELLTAQWKKWTAEFRSGRKIVEDYKWSGRPKEATTDGNIELVHSLIMWDRSRSQDDIARHWDSSVCLDRYLKYVQILS